MTYKIPYLRFVAFFVGFTLAIPVILYAVQALFGVDASSSGTAIIPMMIASMDQGTQFAKTQDRRPDGSEAWAISLRLTGVAFVLSLIFAVVAFALNPEMFAVLGAVGVAIIMAIIAVLFWVLGRIFVGLGAKSHMKAVERQR